MKVSELILSLEHLLRTQGDLEVMREGKTGGPRMVSPPRFRHLTTSRSRFWDSRINNPESKGQKVCVL